MVGHSGGSKSLLFFQQNGVPLLDAEENAGLGMLGLHLLNKLKEVFFECRKISEANRLSVKIPF